MCQQWRCFFKEIQRYFDPGRSWLHLAILFKFSHSEAVAKTFTSEQKHAKDTITGKKSNDKLQDSKDVASIGWNASSANTGTQMRKKRPTIQPKETDETNLDEIINEILEIPAADSGASEKDLMLQQV